ncbi:DarT ssDNA thymidine ADP-ribosyltransferase family protein [Curtobacterium sp. RRHDQ10]|uniref:DarT ssDNA thymidine ADP-ribosyltransferase family protein n=1 Tax=Curtobacterium phyllosphaerae TaxID=3413379 RepID=UPI003BF12AD2
MTECIHGFPTELCDICSPRQRPESADAPKTPAPRRTRVSSSLRSEKPSAAAKRGASAAAPELPVRVFSALRAHHWTHLDNLGGIVADNAILASTSATPDIDVSAPDTRAARSATATPDGSSVAEHVPFELSADAAAWDQVRSGATEPRWSESARRARGTDFVMLVVPTPAFGDSVILSDTTADDPTARFAVGPDAATALLRRAAVKDPEMLHAELLAGPSVPFTSVAVIGVPNDRMRDDVRALLADAGGHVPRVAIFPPWFRPAPAEAV